MKNRTDTQYWRDQFLNAMDAVERERASGDVGAELLAMREAVEVADDMVNDPYFDMEVK